MLISPFNGFADFKVVDDFTGREVEDVVWINTDTLEVAVMAKPYGYNPMTLEANTEVRSVTMVRVDYVNRRVHVNEPPMAAITVKPPKACSECAQDETCRRIHYCAAYRCNFGEVAKP